MLLKLLLLTGVFKCRCRFVYKYNDGYGTYEDFYYDPNKGVSVEAIPDDWLNSEVLAIVPCDQNNIDIYVK